MLITAKKAIQNQAIEYYTSDFYYDYMRFEHGQEMREGLFCKIVFTFFTRMSTEILKGFNFSSPLGSFYVKKIFTNPNVKYISQAATADARRKGDKDAVVYRNENYYFKLIWQPNEAMMGLKRYEFSASRKNNRETHNNRTILTLNVI